METAQTDRELLRAFADAGDQHAFRLLAERHAGLIYHTALRTWNDRTLAEDVSQRVLAALANKSAKVLRDGVPLSAWLHRTTVLEMKSARRGQARHQRKKEALMLEPETTTPSPGDSRWRDALPHLDAAIDSLPEADRLVLLFHYVEEMTFPRIAGRLEKSTVAVQKRAQRALLKLQQILTRRGVALSIGVIAAGLTTEMAKAAPLAFVTALAAKPAFGKAVTQAIVVKKSTIAAIAATVVLCGVPLASQQVKIHQLEARLARPEIAAAGSEPPATTRANVASGTSRLRTLAKDLLGQNKDIVRYIAAVDLIRAMTDEELAGLMIECVNADLTSFEEQPIFNFACNTLAERNPETALSVLLERIPRSFFGEKNSFYFDLFSAILRNWAMKDSRSALAWFDTHLDVIRSVPRGKDWEGGDLADGLLENKMRLGLSQAFIFTDPTTAVEILRPVPGSMVMPEFEQLGRSNSKEWNEHKDSFIRVIRELLPGDEANKLIGRSASSSITIENGMPDFTDYDKFLDQQDLSDAEREAVILWAGASPMSSFASKGKLREAALRYRKWVATRGIDHVDWHVGAALATMRNNWSGDFEAISKLLSKPGDPEFPDEAVAGFLETVDKSKCNPEPLRKLEDRLQNSSSTQTPSQQ